MIVSIDPGVHGCGMAWWQRGIDSYHLYHASYVKGSDKKTQSAEAWVGTVGTVFAAKRNSVVEIEHAVIELPQVYGAWSKSKGDPNDLIQVAAVVGGLAWLWEGEVEIYLPREWKGQSSKKATKHRLIEYQLTESELGKVVLPGNAKNRTDVWDAVALGVRYLVDKKLRIERKPERWSGKEVVMTNR